MKSRSVAACALVTAVVAASGAEPQAGKDREKGRIEGTWEQSSPGFPKNLRQIKVINKDHQLWASYDRATGKVGSVAGGPYTFDGATYKEKVEFGHLGTPQLQGMVGKEQAFTLKFEGDDQFTQTGTLTTGNPIREVWKRVK